MRTTASRLLAVCALVGITTLAILAGEPDEPSPPDSSRSLSTESNHAAGDAKLQNATFGSGCFWCTEAVFEQLKGVKSVVSGYSGGEVPRPTYEEVSSGTSGYAEVVQITFDPAVISYADLLRVFWQTHDPTTLNRQGADVGPQYRSAIFYHSNEQRKIADQYKRQLDDSGEFKSPLVTEVTAYKNFYPAENYHQDYFELNPAQRYCALVIRPKVAKFQKEFKELLQEEAGTSAAEKK
jgi:methionine-S-sulfoxide reductase